jgi:molybdopterin-guanine dinucleotide biosynthesis protein MobB
MGRDPVPVDPGPVLAVCGWSGSGKTTLLEAIIPELRRQGLAVAAVKHDAHGLDVDRPGKDSDRLFRAGADIAVHGPGEALRRNHAPQDVLAAVRELRADHDIVLVEGHKATPLPKVWLASHDDASPPDDVTGVLAVLPLGGDRLAAALELLRGWLPRAWREVPVLGGVLIGGASRRMGTPKHLLTLDGTTFLERVLAAVEPAVRGVVLLGAGEVTGARAGTPRVADAPGVEGPLAGILAAMRWAPNHAWLVAACDLPRVTADAVEWLLAQRAPGRWAVVPKTSGGVEPLLALYEPQARLPLERVAALGQPAPRLLAEHPRAWVVSPPATLGHCWDNVNTPRDLAAFADRDPETGSDSTP